jgi:hypothetical protein
MAGITINVRNCHLTPPPEIAMTTADKSLWCQAYPSRVADTGRRCRENRSPRGVAAGRDDGGLAE